MNEGKSDKKGAKSVSESEKLKHQLADYKETLQRLQAEFENYKKRVEKDVALSNACSRQDFIKKLLPVIDSFELALKNKEGADFKKGVEMIYAELYSLLRNEGLAPIDALGKRFDPYVHEAVMKEESDEDEVVLEEFQRGYKLGDAVIRHSKVKIGAKCEPKQPAQES